jgi:hypothetical protein
VVIVMSHLLGAGNEINTFGYPARRTWLFPAAAMN